MSHFKYPKTQRFKAISLNEHASWKHLTAVVEEKVDGANSAIHFEDDSLILQSRGHILGGGARELQFDLFKQQCRKKESELRTLLGNRYVLFGEWCYAKHRIFYDALPAYFIEFDIFDKQDECFFSTTRRKEFLATSSISSVKIIHTATFDKINNFEQYITKSNYKTDKWFDAFTKVMNGGLSKFYDLSETDQTQLMEGIYVKIEDEEKVIGRFKMLRSGLTKVRDNDDRWGRRPIFPNNLL